MDAERARAFLLRLPHAVETMQWGANLVFWVGDKALGGKMFALIDLDGAGHAAVSFALDAERAAELLETDGLFPAPYLARAHWVAAKGWDALRDREWQDCLQAAHATVLARLPRRTREMLDLPAKEQKRLLAERRQVLAERAAAKAQAEVRPAPAAGKKRSR